jgi:hypothetical protein
MSLEDLVRQRRKDIENSAPCVGCGSTLESCKGLRGTDPTAPPWFGCCARGTEMVPCSHVPDYKALIELLREIESGEVRSAEDVLLDSVQEFPSRTVSRVLIRRGHLGYDSWFFDDDTH